MAASRPNRPVSPNISANCAFGAGCVTNTRAVAQVYPRQNPMTGPTNQIHSGDGRAAATPNAPTHPHQMPSSVRLAPHQRIANPKLSAPTTANAWLKRKNCTSCTSENPRTRRVYTAMKTITVLIALRLKSEAQQYRHKPAIVGPAPDGRERIGTRSGTANMRKYAADGRNVA